ncbi:hypothetical protein [Streptomyces sp. NPDC050264]|uniref:hypothetical protein n=1 Tax=Streptomyces sp. NPDC050264 TaxID=3155038 RepID=UPI0034497581
MKLTAVAAMVVLALTGFSTGRGHSRGHSSSGGGGGCSSSSQRHDSSSNSSTSGGSSGYSGSSGSTYGDDDDLYGSGTGGSSTTRRPTYRSTPSSTASGSGTATENGTVRLVRCAKVERPYATVEVINPNRKTVTYAVSTTFYDDQNNWLDDATTRIKVPGKGKAMVKVKVDTGDGLISRLGRCEVDPEAREATR